jgi:hypothetical protein
VVPLSCLKSNAKLGAIPPNLHHQPHGVAAAILPFGAIYLCHDVILGHSLGETPEHALTFISELAFVPIVPALVLGEIARE